MLHLGSHRRMTGRLCLAVPAALVLTTLALAAPALAQTSPTQTGAASATLPGGATTLRETFGQWSVECSLPSGTKRCAMTQVQMNRNSQQRVLAVELAAQGKDSAKGALVLPFGLAVAKGVTLQIDDGAVGSTLAFKTCLPAGCVVPLAFDAKTLATLAKATTLKIKAQPAEGDEPVVFTVPLEGFASAVVRTADLSR